MNFSKTLAAVLILVSCFLISACGTYWKQSYPTLPQPSRYGRGGENCDCCKGQSGYIKTDTDSSSLKKQ